MVPLLWRAAACFCSLQARLQDDAGCTRLVRAKVHRRAGFRYPTHTEETQYYDVHDSRGICFRLAPNTGMIPSRTPLRMLFSTALALSTFPVACPTTGALLATRGPFPSAWTQRTARSYLPVHPPAFLFSCRHPHSVTP